MKIAICFSGQFRTGAWAIPSMRSFIGDLWNDCDFFVHTWDTYNNKNYNDSVINKLNNLMSAKIKYKNPDSLQMNPINREDLNRFLTIYNPKLFLIENYKTIYEDEMQRRWDHINIHNFSGDISEYTPAFLYYSFFRSIELMRYYEDRNKFTYDIVIKLRPDIVFPMKDGGSIYEYFTANLNNDIIKVLNDPSKFYVAGDVYWISTSEVMKKISLYWEESLKISNLSLSSYCHNLDIEMDPTANTIHTFLRNPFKRIPLDDYYLVDCFERFFIDMEPTDSLLKKPIDPEYKKHALEKMKTYIHHYDIIKELCDEIHIKNN